MKNYSVIILTFLLTSVLFPQEGGKVSGQVFGDYFYNAQLDTGLASLPNTAFTGRKDSSGFQFRRINLNYDYTFSVRFFSRFRIETDQQSNTPGNRWGIFVKDASIRWNNVFKGSDLIFGIQPTPSFEISEAGWSHRFLEKTIMDLRGIESSRDFAISLRGKFDNQGVFNYWFMAGNGSGNAQEINKEKKLYGTFFVKPSDRITLSLFADYAFRPAKSFSGFDLNNNDAVTSALYFGYNDKVNFSLGLESFLHIINNDVSRIEDVMSIASRNIYGISLFTTYSISKMFDITARADYYDPDSDIKGDSRFFYIASLDYKPHSLVTISPNIMVETFEKTLAGKSFDPSVTARLTISWNYR